MEPILEGIEKAFSSRGHYPSVVAGKVGNQSVVVKRLHIHVAAPFEVVLTPDRLLDVTVDGERAALQDLVGRYRDAGATMMNLRFRHRSLDHYLEQLALFAAEIAPRLA